MFPKLSGCQPGQAHASYMVPVTVTVAVPGVVVMTPVAASCVNVAAGTVICPATVADEEDKEDSDGRGAQECGVMRQAAFRYYIEKKRKFCAINPPNP